VKREREIEREREREREKERDREREEGLNESLTPPRIEPRNTDLSVRALINLSLIYYTPFPSPSCLYLFFASFTTSSVSLRFFDVWDSGRGPR
jgi:hypothetical protein